MQTKTSKPKRTSKTSLRTLLAKATSATNLLEAARQHLRGIKAEHKQARKAFRQVKKAARRACKQAEAAARKLKVKAKKK
jgi:Zn-dependent M32 family carboxypeptidase